MDEVLPVRLIARRYRQTETLHEGRFTIVCRAQDVRRPGRSVVLKLLSAQADPARQERFRREALLLPELSHPSIVRFADAGFDAVRNAAFLAMEDLGGATLAARTGDLKPHGIVDVALDVARALDALHHRGIVHFDVKPENIAVRSGTSKRAAAVLFDFDLAGPPGSPSRGTLPYAAPEIFRDGTGDGASDFYSLGVSLYAALAGVLPPELSPELGLETPEEGFLLPDPVRGRVPAALVELVRGLTLRDPRARLSSCEDMRRILLVGGVPAGPAETPAARLAALDPLPLVGREDVTETLARLGAAADGPPARPRRPLIPLILVAGEGGTGRTRMLERHLREQRLRGGTVARGAVAEAAGRPFQLLGVVAESLAGALDEDPAGEDARIERCLKRGAAAAVDPGLHRGDPDVRADRLPGFEALVSEWMERVKGRSVTVGIDDLDRADPLSLGLLVHLARRAAAEVRDGAGAGALQIVATVGPEAARPAGLTALIDELERDRLVYTVSLANLAPPDTQKLLAILGGREASTPADEIVGRVQDLTAGNPLFLGAWLRSLAEPAKGELEFPRLLEDPARIAAAPGAIAAIVALRLEACSNAERALLESLAVAPELRSEADLAEFLGEPVPGISRGCQSLEDRGIIVDDGSGWRLREALAAEAILGAMDDDARRRLHDRAAGVLEGRGDGSPHRGAVAIHRLRGSRAAESAGAAFEAAERLLADQRDEECVELLRELRGVLGRSDRASRRRAVRLLAEVLPRTGRLAEAVTLVEEELAEAPDPGLALDAGHLHLQSGSCERAREIAGELLRPGSGIDTATRADLALIVAASHLDQGRHEEAESVFTEIESILAGTGFPFASLHEPAGSLAEVTAPRFYMPSELADRVAALIRLRGEAAVRTRALGPALRLAMTGLKIEARLGHMAGLAHALHTMGTVFMLAENYDVAERHYQRALALRRDLGDLAGVADTYNNLGIMLRRRGRTLEAVECHRQSLKLRKRIGHLRGEANSYLNIANIYYLRRELEPAERYLRRALDLNRRLGDISGTSKALNTLAAADLLLDRYGAAMTWLREAEELARTSGDLRGALLKRLNLAEIHARIGSIATAESLCRPALDTVRAEGLAKEEALALSTLARCALERSRHEEAEHLYSEALSRLQTCGTEEEIGETILDRAELEIERGHPGAALALLTRIEGGALSEEARVLAHTARARAELAVGRRPDRQLLDALHRDLRTAEHRRIPSLMLGTAAVLARIHDGRGEPEKALMLLVRALNALDTMRAALADPSLEPGFLASARIRGYVAHVAAFAEAHCPPETFGRTADLPVLDALKIRLFDAGRAIGVESLEPRRTEDGIRRILELTKTLNSAAPLSDLLERVVDGVIDLLRAERVFLILVDEKGRRKIAVARDHHREAIPSAETQVSRHIVDEALKSRRPLLLQNAMDEGAFWASESVVGLELRSILAVPLLRGNVLAGAICADNRTRVGQFTEDDLELLDVFASQVAVALENARLIRQFVRDEKMRAMGQITGGVAHDFNNLLTSILGRVQMLRERAGDPDTARSLAIVEKAAIDGAAIVRRLQDFARVSRVEPVVQAVRVAEIVDDTIEFTRGSWEARALRAGRRISIENRIAPDVFVRGQPSELREVLINIVLNGVLAMPDGGSLTFEAAATSDRVAVSVTDTGVGMADDVRENLFDPFFTTRGAEGNGLGMSVVLSIVARHGGTIDVVSAPGRGTRITLDLPRAQPEETASGRTPAPRAAAPRGSGERILVVDDEEPVRQLLAEVLRTGGYEVVEATGGRDVPEILRDPRVRAVVTDLGMLPISGFDVARQTRALRPELPVILVTGWAGEIEPELARRHQVDYLVSKPFEVPELLETLHTALTRHTRHGVR